MYNNGMKARYLIPLSMLCVAFFPARAEPEIVLLKSGEKLEGDIVISHDRGLLFREKEGSPGRYYPYEQVSRIHTKDNKLYYLMPRKARAEKKSHFEFFPFARVILPSKKEVAPIPYITLPSGEAVEVKCRDASDAVTLELEGGAKVRLLGLSPPPKGAGVKIYGKALEELSNRVKGKKVLLFPGPQVPDDAGIAAAYVVVGKEFLNAEMLENGWASVSPSPEKHPYREAFTSLQKLAKNLHRGIWGNTSD